MYGPTKPVALEPLERAFMRVDADQRATMFTRALTRRSEPTAQRLLEAIQGAWLGERRTLPKFVDERSPDLGLLRALGYHVGLNQGCSHATRRLLLDYLMREEAIPPIKDEAYMQQWGLPNTRTRKVKLVRVLRNLATDHEDDLRYGVAVSEWLDDAAYVNRAWPFYGCC